MLGTGKKGLALALTVVGALVVRSNADPDLRLELTVLFLLDISPFICGSTLDESRATSFETVLLELYCRHVRR